MHHTTFLPSSDKVPIYTDLVIYSLHTRSVCIARMFCTQNFCFFSLSNVQIDFYLVLIGEAFGDFKQREQIHCLLTHFTITVVTFGLFRQRSITIKKLLLSRTWCFP